MAYRDALIDRINKLPSEQPPHGRPCDVPLRGKRSAAGLRYYREGSRYLVFRATADTLIVLDFFHGHKDLDHHTAELVAGTRNDDREEQEAAAVYRDACRITSRSTPTLAPPIALDDRCLEGLPLEFWHTQHYFVGTGV